MAIHFDGILYDELTADPESPSNGQRWYNSTDKQCKVRINGVTEVLALQKDLQAHIDDDENPHGTTLEQARTAGNELAGDIDMGGNQITDLGDPAIGSDATNMDWVKAHVDSKLQGLDWQNSVIRIDLTSPPPTPAQGDRYIIAGPATGLWTGKEDQIAEWNGTAWVYTVPNKGYALTNEADDVQYNFNGTDWVNIGGSVPKGTPVEITDSTNAQGDGLAFAVNNHQHSHGSRGGGSLHSLTSAAGAGFQPQSNRAATAAPTVNDDNTDGYAVGSYWIDVSADREYTCLDASTGAAVWKETTTGSGSGCLAHKSGTVLAASFSVSGGVHKATVTFSAEFADANYSVALTDVTSSGASFKPSVDNTTPKAKGSFVISLNSGNKNNLVAIDWIAMKHGESSF